jgi:replicative DNA helicase
LWRIAREFNTTILLLAQLSRSGDKKHPFPPPTMTSLKGSGAIEQLAWAVWFVYRIRDDNNLPTTDTQFIFAKNRSGVTGVRRLEFDARHIRFHEVAREG